MKQNRIYRTPLQTSLFLLGLLIQLPSGNGLYAQFYTDKLLVPNGGEKNPEWKVASGFTLIEDSTGYTSPVGAALVPHPASGPEAPLFLSTELRGLIKARLRNGKVIDVVEDETVVKPRKELPDFQGETGQTGICFSPDGKKLFTTGVYSSGWGLINRITEWRPLKQDWSKIQKVRDFTKIFENDTTGMAHQIGHCVIDENNHLWVGIGDGQKFKTSHMKDSSNGKILRMDLNLKPVKSNPFYRADREDSIESYIYAMGVRNSFALAKIPGGSLYAADNGPEMDRLLKVEKGFDYPWDNTNISMTYNNLLTFPNPIGPSGLIYVPKNHPLKKLRGHLIVAGAHITSLLAIPVDEQLGINGEPWWLVRPTQYFPDRKQDFTGLTLMDDGILITHIRMHMKGGLLPSPILKLVPGEIQEEEMEYSGEQLIHVSGCRSCHTIAGIGGNVGPLLDTLKGRLAERLENDSYLSELKDLQGFADEPDHEKWSHIRDSLIKKEGSLDERMKLWIISKITNPNFEKQASGMPLIELKDSEREKIADFLLTVSDRAAVLGGLDRWDYKIQKQLELNPRIPLFLTAISFLLIGLYWKKLSAIPGKILRRMKRKK